MQLFRNIVQNDTLPVAIGSVAFRLNILQALQIAKVDTVEPMFKVSSPSITTKGEDVRMSGPWITCILLVDEQFLFKRTLLVPPGIETLALELDPQVSDFCPVGKVVEYLWESTCP